MNKQQPNWYGFEMLSLYLSISEGHLETCKEQLQNLEAIQNRPYILDDNTVDRIIKLCNNENEFTSLYIEQCRRWRDQNPTKQQLDDICQLESNERKHEEINKKILFLANNQA